MLLEGGPYHSLCNMSMTKNKKNGLPSPMRNFLDPPMCLKFSSYLLSSLQTTAVRISAESNNSNIDYPTIFVVRQERSVLSWQIPLLLQYT